MVIYVRNSILILLIILSIFSIPIFSQMQNRHEAASNKITNTIVEDIYALTNHYIDVTSVDYVRQEIILKKTLDDIDIYYTLYPKKILILRDIVENYYVLIRKMEQDNNSNRMLELHEEMYNCLKLYLSNNFVDTVTNAKLLDNVDNKMRELIKQEFPFFEELFIEIKSLK